MLNTMSSNEEKAELRTRTRDRSEVKRTSIHPSAKTKKSIRSWVRGDLIALENRDDGFEYRWCDGTNTVKMAQRTAQGFIRVTSTSGLHAQNAGQADISHSGPTTQGVVEMGDLVLMALPTELAEERRQAVTEVNKEALTGMTEDFESHMNRVGAPVTGEGVQMGTKVKIEI